MVRLLDNRVMILGGTANRRGVMVYDGNNFTSGPTMISGRQGLGCTLFHSRKHAGRPVVLVVGGIDTGYGDVASELLDYTRSGATWEGSKSNISTISM